MLKGEYRIDNLSKKYTLAASVVVRCGDLWLVGWSRVADIAVPVQLTLM